MTTDPGDLVLDPTCGSGTTAYVAENWGRRWITIDTSRVALTLARARLMGAKYDYFVLRDSPIGAVEEAKLTGKLSGETIFTSDIRLGFVYERAARVTLRSIANNAEIDVIWDRFQTELEPLRATLNRTVGKAWQPRVSRSGLVPFEGRYTENGELRRGAICIGPEYDTVGYDLVKKAAREAADLYDTLIVCGFAFAPEVDETRLNFGSLIVLKARMNQDLRMGDKLKATGASNLFVIFGEPDLRVIEATGDLIRIEIKGMDIFDPTTGEVRSSGGNDLKNDVAAWFIDDDYNEESFFVRQAYFVGRDPYDALKRALKIEIDETAWEEMNSTISRPFPRPTSGRVCVKVINHFGDEVQKVFEV
jgi:DNA methylase